MENGGLIGVKVQIGGVTQMGGGAGLITEGATQIGGGIYSEEHDSRVVTQGARREGQATF